ncbi:DNA-processing protein DprA [Amycolatopsis azurea]|uniref:DNA processing protein DprA n=1 Tax=Amycolatopsis azurea DSM 43854 TaxID=1238180 RepID=M2PTH8_9PSEU|nr:DNA-processing protein DprA [Amycolatopsis azurea]EMD27888.1 Rossmann fold nucleotide-binding protein Smf [Amycolatopsis azurea DSM 43854]OOC03364.1 DNA processing protein DprA [Amycolatopsis azurea DSM 43854]
MSELDAERIARSYLLRVAEPPAPALVGFVGEHGPIVAAERVARADCPPKVRDETAARRAHDYAERDLERAAAGETRLVIPEDDEWPAWPLLSLAVAQGRGVSGAAPPLALWVRGPVRLDEAVDQAIAIVGARAATEYGEHNAAELGYHLASRGIPVFSGAAYGIDGAAHRGALSADGTTVALLGCGIDAGYPAQHTTLLRTIGKTGAVVSEYPPGTSPARHRFLVRNRLIAALTEGTVVVEAGRRSGARNTAGTAGVLGKVVMAMPGPVSSGMSAGCHALIREGEATLVTSVDEVLETAGRLGEPGTDPAKPRRHTDRLGPEALRVHDALSERSPRPEERIAAESGVPVDRVRALLPGLELDGFAERGDTGWRRRPART